MLKPGAGSRRGAHAVEFAFVASIFLMFVFGVLEYGRLVFTRQVVINAAREGARYAVVNITDATIVTDTQNYVKTMMAGQTSMVTNYNCQVYMADNTGKNIGAAGNAAFGQYVAVQIDCDYSSLLPSFLLMNQTFKLNSKAMMFSEAN